MSLRLLAPGTGPDGNGIPAIDIVAVHGLNPINSTDHAFNTWRKPLDSEGCLWLRDCFPKAQPNARIYLYEYNSSPVFGAAKDSFVSEANQLLDEIYGERWQMDGDTPLILVGHSLGGILIKQALVNAWANEKYRGIKQATHALVFFGTPHAGPSRNMQVELGMACARIARSLPFGQTSKMVEILEGGTLFSDLLSESFRHQLEQYKILSCYEGLGDIVPFNSAVLGLPGNRETQLRINADHSNMCRFDVTTQADKDNYRKVERNLQMLCADALIKTSREGARSDVPMKDLASQGGVDLSSVLMQQLDRGPTNNDNLLLKSFADAPELAWQVYRLCEQSRAAAFTEAATDVSRLFVGIRGMKDRLETDTFSTDNSAEISTVMSNCCRTLQSFQAIIGIYQDTPARSRAHWNSNSSRAEFYGLKTLKADLQANISMINTLNRDLARRSMNDLTEMLDEVIQVLNSGDENLTALSSSLSRASLSDVGEWSDIGPDLVEAGISPNILSEQGEYIQQWLMNALKAGRIDVESLPDHGSRTVNSGHPNSLEGRVRNDGGESINASRSGIRSASPGPDSVLTRPLSSESQQLEMATVDSSAPRPKHASKLWTHSLTSKLRYGTLSSHDAIAKAVQSGDASSAQKILASINKIDTSWAGWSYVLGGAIERGWTGAIGDLIARGVFMDRNDDLSSGLSLAIKRKDVKTMTLFLENKVPFQTEHLVSAMTFAAESIIDRIMDSMSGNLDHERYAYLLLYNAAKYDQRNCFQSLVTQYGGINAAIDKSTPFHLACSSGNARSIQLALDLGGNVRITDARGDSPLHALIRGGGDPRYEIGATIMLLVRNGALLRGQSGDGQTALHLATRCAYIKAMEALMQMGLSPDIKTPEGKTPLHYACKSEWVQRTVEDWLPWYLRDGHRVTRFNLRFFLEETDIKDPTEDTCYPKQADEAIRLLLRYGASVNVRGMENVTPLHLASASKTPSRMKVLLDHGADVQAVDDWGWAPLHYAIVSGSQEAVDLLNPHGVDPEKPVSIKIMGDYQKQLNAFDILKIVNSSSARGFAERRLQLRTDDT